MIAPKGDDMCLHFIRDYSKRFWPKAKHSIGIFRSGFILHKQKAPNLEDG